MAPIMESSLGRKEGIKHKRVMGRLWWNGLNDYAYKRFPNWDGQRIVMKDPLNPELQTFDYHKDVLTGKSENKVSQIISYLFI